MRNGTGAGMVNTASFCARECVGIGARVFSFVFRDGIAGYGVRGAIGGSYGNGAYTGAGAVVK